MTKHEAPEGTVWVCVACGKRAKNRMTGGLSPKWDESCMIWARLCRKDKIEINKRGFVERVTEEALCR